MKQFVVSVLLYNLWSVAVFGQQLQEDYLLNIENVAVNKYMSEVFYEPHDETLIEQYNKGLSYRADIPDSLMLNLPENSGADSLLIVCYDFETLADSLLFKVSTENKTVALYNFIPQRTYRYEVKDEDTILKYGFIKTEGQVRMLQICNTVNNIRDMGGWKTADGKRIRYGKIFRGSELNGTRIATAEGIELLKALGVEAEFDLRAWYNTAHNVSAFNFLDSYRTPIGEVPSFYYSNNSGQLPIHIDSTIFKNKWRYEFQFIVNNLRVGRGIYQHCVQGKDRTGYLSLLLEGLLGVPYSDILKDYELSFFFYDYNHNKDSIDKVFDFIETMEGETLRDKFNTYFTKKLYVSQTDIDYFRDVMLEAIEPEDDIVTFAGPKKRFETNKYKERIYNIKGQSVAIPHKGNIYLVRDKDEKMKKLVVGR